MPGAHAGTHEPAGTDPIPSVVNYNESVLASKEVTGFAEPENVVVSYDQGTRKVTLTGAVKALYRGAVIPALVSGWQSPAHDPGPTQTLYLKYNGGGFSWSTTPWSFDEVQIAYVCYTSDGTFRFAQREVHGSMPWQTHRELHQTLGTYRETGGDVGGLVPASVAQGDRRPTVTACLLYDEDLPTTNPIHNSKNDYTRLYLNGAAGDPECVKNALDVVPLSGSNPQYNQFTLGAWQLMLVPNNDYFSVWLIGIPASADAESQKARFVWMIGQSTGTLVGQRGLTPGDLSLGNFAILSPEFTFLEKLIYRYTSGDWVFVESQRITGTKAGQVASPSGNYLTTVASDATLTGDGTGGSPLSVAYGAVADTACEGDDARLSDARTPILHAATHENGGGDEISVAGLSGLLADAQTPSAHASSHSDGGADEVSVLDLGGYPGGTANFLRADGAFAAPPGGGGGAFEAWWEANNLANISNNFAHLYKSAKQNENDVTHTNPIMRWYDSPQNGGADTIVVPEAGNLTEIRLAFQGAAVGTGTVGAAPTVRIGFYKENATGSGWTLLAYRDIPISPTGVGTFNNSPTGSPQSILNDMGDVAVAAGDVIGWVFINAAQNIGGGPQGGGVSDDRINAIRCLKTSVHFVASS